MYVSKSLVFVVGSLILVILVILIMSSNNSLKNESSMGIQSTDNTSDESALQMVVIGEPSRQIQSMPQFNVWEIMDELWSEPRYYSNNIKFRDGVIDFTNTGFYRVTVDLNVIFYNDSYNDIPVEILLRVIQGGIRHRFEYDLQDIANSTSQLYRVPSRSRHSVVLSCDAIIEITRADIADGSNSATAQYMVRIDESNPDVSLSSERLSIDRNDEHVTSRITVVKLN